MGPFTWDQKAAYIRRNLPMVERVFKILKLIVISPHDSIKCQSWGVFEKIAFYCLKWPKKWPKWVNNSHDGVYRLKMASSSLFVFFNVHTDGSKWDMRWTISNSKMRFSQKKTKIDTLYYHGVK